MDVRLLNSTLKEARTKYRHEWISASHDLNCNPDRSPDPGPEKIIELPEGTLTIFKNQKSTQEEQSPVQSLRPHNLWRKPKRKKSTPTGNPKQLVVADDNDAKKPKKKRTKPLNKKLMIGQDPQPISSEDSVEKFETRMAPNHLFQLITEINKPTDLKEEPHAVDYRQLQRQAIRDMGFGVLLDLKIKNIPTALCSFLANNFQIGARQVPLNGYNVLDIKQEDVVAVLDLPREPKQCEYERVHPRSFPVIKSWDQKMLDDRVRLQGSNFTDVQTLERLKKPSSAASRDEQLETESQEDTQANPNTQQVYVDLAVLYEKFYQLIITMSKTVLDIREKEMELKIEPDEQAKANNQDPNRGNGGLEQLSQTNDEASLPVGKFVPTSKEVVVDEQQTQPQGAQGLDQLSQTNDEASLPVGKSMPTSKEVVVDEQQTQPQAHGMNISTIEKKRSHQDSTGRDSGVTSTYTKRSRSTGTWKRKVFKDPTIPHFNLGIFSSQEDSYETTQEKNTEEDITGSVDLDKDVNETIEAEEYPVPSALDETKNPTPSIDEIIRRASAPASESLSDTKKLEMIAAAAEQVEKNSKVVETVPLSIIPPDWNIASTTGGLLMLEKNECTTPPPAISKKADELDEELTKTVEKNFLFEFGKIVWADRTAFYSMREGTWIENSIIDAWAVILNKEEAKSDSPRRIFFGVSSFDTISRYYQPGSNKEEIEFTFYERLVLELEEQGLTVASLIAAKAFRFFQSFVECVFPRIELVSAQYTFTEVMLPSHKDKTPNAEDCGIYTMHHLERYDGGEYEDRSTLDFNTGNIKEYRWKYMIKILMHPANKNKDKILEAMHQFYTNTAEEERKEIPDHVDLSSKSYYNDRKI
ncbi:OLC1v1030550C1 [Oldenlandia corymbosa var. corymbosa]|uniref:OLC1v1030550C1 n=1 Tax=Oldenlandia corymbosa var. corymbosa TaxID=529605 RepID=A0AAV1CGC2_OLDCO|nr:OLC1v1030550C1 [Oldenlandia corymbosa var. corymbosa]